MSNFGDLKRGIYFGLMIPSECGPADWTAFGLHLRRIVEELDKQGESLKETGGGISEQRGMLAWAIGDWLLKGKEIGVKPPALRKQVRAALKGQYSTGTLSNFMTVSKAFKDFSRRRENVSYSHHLLIAKFDDIKIQDELFDRVEKGKYSTRRLTAYIEDKQKVGLLPAGRQKPKSSSTVVSIRLQTSIYERFLEYADVMRLLKRPDLTPDPGKVLLWMAAQYYEKHKAEFKEMLATRSRQGAVPGDLTSNADAEPERELATIDDY
jgi:hypothetical protein